MFKGYPMASIDDICCSTVGRASGSRAREVLSTTLLQGDCWLGVKVSEAVDCGATELGPTACGRLPLCLAAGAEYEARVRAKTRQLKVLCFGLRVMGRGKAAKTLRQRWKVRCGRLLFAAGRHRPCLLAAASYLALQYSAGSTPLRPNVAHNRPAIAPLAACRPAWT